VAWSFEITQEDLLFDPGTFVLALVAWDDGTRSSVSIRNLVCEDRRHLEAN
jgi:hypothetical protein